jgi:HPt (histidine-containing phosphotransfer) domain-containing protein
MPRRLTDLYRVADEGDAEAVRRSAHAVRSPSAMLGATALAERLRAIEESTDPVRELTQQHLDALVHDTLEQIQTALDRMASSDGGGVG